MDVADGIRTLFARVNAMCPNYQRPVSGRPLHSRQPCHGCALRHIDTTELLTSGACQPGERLAIEAEALPVGHWSRTLTAVELERRFVPVEHGPLEAGQPFTHAAPGEVDEQRLADAPPPRVGLDE